MSNTTVSANTSARNTASSTGKAPASGVSPLMATNTTNTVFSNPDVHRRMFNNTPSNDTSNNPGAGLAMPRITMITNTGIDHPRFNSGRSNDNVLNAAITSTTSIHPQFYHSLPNSSASGSVMPPSRRTYAPTSLSHVVNNIEAAHIVEVPDSAVNDTVPSDTNAESVAISAAAPESTVDNTTLTATASNDITINTAVPTAVADDTASTDATSTEVTKIPAASVSPVRDTASTATTEFTMNAASVMTDNLASATSDLLAQGKFPPPQQFAQYPCPECGAGIICWGPNSTPMANHVADCKGRCERCQKKNMACEKRGENVACKPCHTARVEGCVFAMDSRARGAEVGPNWMVSKAVRDLREMRDGSEDEMDWE